MKPVRLDALLVKQGLAASRARARELIEAGKVVVDGIVAQKPARQVQPHQSIKLLASDYQWVSRGALKLLGVIEPFAIDATDRVCADLGASTGGFTEVLLEHGAKKVYAIDVGTNQLNWKIRTNERVVVMDATNVRYVESLPEPIDLVVGDLSFIGLALILPAVTRILAPNGEAVLLVKPQFEAGPTAIARGGRVRTEALRLGAIANVVAEAERSGFDVIHREDCGVPGAKAGNIEHFLHLKIRDSP